MSSGTGHQPAGWHPDPWQRSEYRYWDGARWTEHVVRHGQQTVDHLGSTPHVGQVPAAIPSPVAAPPQQFGAGTPGQPPPAARPQDIPLFGARGRARELSGEVDSLRAEVARLGRLDVLSAAELEQRTEALHSEIAAQQARLEQERAAATQLLRQEISQLTQQRDQVIAQLAGLRQEVVVTEEEAVLQEVGIYRYRHPLSDAVAYQAELSRLRDRIKTMTRKDGGAVLGSTTWSVNGSASQGRAMVRDFSKLMLRAYNAEADNLVRGLKPYKLDSAIDRLTKVAWTIAKLGSTMDIRISQAYHELRVAELELTADYVELQAQQKEREREERERLREERRVQEEMEREKARLEKERQHHANVLAALREKGDEEGVGRLEEQLAEIDRRIQDVDYRAANVRAGYVYVISNFGSFGERIVKVGLTRRLEPLDRIRELGDASVPFKFDIHALFFSKDAVGIEAELHRRLADRRVNLVNTRREFFYATPVEIKQHLLELTGELLEYEELAEALEYRQSVSQRPATASD